MDGEEAVRVQDDPGITCPCDEGLRRLGEKAGPLALAFWLDIWWRASLVAGLGLLLWWGLWWLRH